ncbi:hypothetical protein CROQUDRAFT_76057 [Cronartium quercuum f. sp. fusiforme G11]|uniref:Uncharacterized protein n=1 Tax=Cronartium quercuum f. sp. fusiforme G11 TaxID=708437 RepID=A0A9P6NPK4_9BASI|nr:hypothetical protein CROQUDRAFT_76057 [Cronartium quercuum f. sp. fusiforme G11]
MPESSRGNSFNSPPALFGTQAIDQAICGIGAGCVSVLCMHPLDLLKVKFQVSTKDTKLNNQKRLKILTSLHDIIRNDGWKGLYRGLGPNMLGNTSSWGLYFLWYSIIKNKMSLSNVEEEKSRKLSASEHLLASATSGMITAMMTNPLWVIKTRMFTSQLDDQNSYKNVLDGLKRINKEEGFRGLWKGSILALIGVSNGAIHFMIYEELKKWRQEVNYNKKIKEIHNNHDLLKDNDLTTLSNLEYVGLSGIAKLSAISITYPYQVIRSRLQSQLYINPTNINKSIINNKTHYHSIPHCISQTYYNEGIKAFYKGLGTNAIRVLPGTCVTFLVYENLSNWFKDLALKNS